jgi:hypothetical protein
MLRLNKRSLQNCIRALDRVGKTVTVAASAAARDGGSELFAVIQQNMSLKDHTLADLAEMDHPYAKRHGSIKIHNTGGSGLLHPEFRVHTHSGKLLRSLKRQRLQREPGAHTFRIFADEAVADYAAYVLNPEGTKKMFGRNVFADAAASPDTRAKIDVAVMNALKGRLAKVGVRVK